MKMPTESMKPIEGGDHFYWQILIFLLFGGCLSKPTSTTDQNYTASRPNIIMVVVDDLRWDELSVMGHPFLSTPHIDRLAE